jgi:hypothetical protein
MLPSPQGNSNSWEGLSLVDIIPNIFLFLFQGTANFVTVNNGKHTHESLASFKPGMATYIL